MHFVPLFLWRRLARNLEAFTASLVTVASTVQEQGEKRENE